LPTYRSLFGTDLATDYPDLVRALTREGLIVVDAAELRLTQKGMFFADSVAGLFAWRRSSGLRLHKQAQDAHLEASAHHMG
jgi:hypothetical protein